MVMKTSRCAVGTLALVYLSCWTSLAGAQPESVSPPAKPEASVAAPAQPERNPGAQAPTINGPSGLFRLVTMDVGTPHTFRVGLHTELSRSSDFLVSGDTNSRYAGTLALSYTPFRYAEFFVNVRSSANSNDRTSEADRLDQEVILALGDLSFGAKALYQITPAFGLGLNLALSLLNSVGGVSFAGGSTGFYVGGISSLDLDPLANVPLRFHLNVGYQLDNSDKLADFDGYGLASLQVEKFALGINPSRVQFKFGIDLPLRRWTKIGVTPIAEFAADVATGEADADFANNSLLTDADIDGRSTLWTTLGLRVNPAAGFNIDLACDIGIDSPGYGYGPPVMPWNFILGLSYGYDPVPQVRVVERVREVARPVEAPRLGRVRGRVINAKTLEPVEGAIVTFPGKDLTGLSTDPDGSFVSYDLPSGQQPLMIRHEDYVAGKVLAEVKLGAVAAMDIKLEPAPPKVGRLNGRVVDLKGNAVSANLALSGPEAKEASADASGAFNLELKPGSYTLRVADEKFLRKEVPVIVAPGGQATVEIVLSPKPRQSLVQVTAKAIVIKRQVHFATGTATIMPDSRQLLDSIVDVLVSNANIKQVEIQGHTDNRGSNALNTQLSQARADAVKDYLVKNGIAAERLTTKGYGPTRPRVPNLSAANRARNRRVEFVILEQ